MARVSQFAKDLGISYNQAKDLVNKGRKRKDGGSEILEKTMSETEKKKKKKKKNTKNKIKPVSRRFEGAPITLELTEDMIGGRKRFPLPDKTIDPKDFLQKPFMPSVEGEDFDPRMMIRRSDGGSNVTKVNKDKLTKAQMGQFKNIVNASTSGKITPAEAQKKIRKMLTMQPPVKKKDGGLGMQSVKYGLDNNPAITAADPKAKFIAANKKAVGGMPRMPQRKPKPVRSMEPSRRRSEPPVTLSPFKGVLKTSEGETLRNIDGTTYLVKPNPKFKRTEKQKAPQKAPIRRRDGGVFRGCGAQVKGKKFKGIF